MSYLRIGTPRRKVRPPRGAPPCTEPVLYGANILKDPGVELHIANTGGGPGGNEIPYSDDFYSTHFLWSDSSSAPEKLSAFIDGGAVGSWAEPWIVSDVNPHSGTYHIRQPNAASDAGALIFNNLQLCSRPNYITWQTAIVMPGDYVKFTWWQTTSSTAGGPAMRAVFDMYDLDGYNLEGYNFDWEAITLSYVQHTAEMFMPDLNGGARFSLRVAIGNASGPSRTVDLDDFSLTVLS